MSEGWIGVDFDGVLAVSGTTVWDGPLGEPIVPMIERVKKWLAAGYEVRIFTARVSPYNKDGSKQSAIEMARLQIRIAEWCERHIGKRLYCTCCKDHNIIALIDDRAVHAVRNTGELDERALSLLGI